MAEFTGVTTHLLTPSDIRVLAGRHGIHPTKKWGQNFVVDPGTVDKIVRQARVYPHHTVIEVGPGLGSLTLGLLDSGARVWAVEIDETLGQALPHTAKEYAPEFHQHLNVIIKDALTLTPEDFLDSTPTHLVANLPYNVAVPVILHMLATFPSIDTVLVMVQAEVAERIIAQPGTRIYGVPSVKVAWFGQARAAGKIGRAVFWPVPRVDSALVRIEGQPPPPTRVPREVVFDVVDAAFAQRRKTLRAALGEWAGSPARAEEILTQAGIEHTRRGETLTIEDFIRIAESSERI